MKELVPHYFPMWLELPEDPKDMNALFPIEGVTTEYFRKERIGKLDLEHDFPLTYDSPHVRAFPFSLLEVRVPNLVPPYRTAPRFPIDPVGNEMLQILVVCALLLPLVLPGKLLFSGHPSVGAVRAICHLTVMGEPAIPGLSLSHRDVHRAFAEATA